METIRETDSQEQKSETTETTESTETPSTEETPSFQKILLNQNLDFPSQLL